MKRRVKNKKEKSYKYIIPNKTIPKYVEDNFPTLWIEFQHEIALHGNYDKRKDIYHQPLSIILQTFRMICNKHKTGLTFKSLYLDEELNDVLKQLEDKL